MKKHKQGLLIASQMDVAMAFARGEHIPKRQRRQLVMKHFKAQASISLTRATTIAIKYGLGLLDEAGATLNKLTLAWLRIGEHAWGKIVAKARNFDWVGISYSRLCKKLRRILLHRKPAWAW